MSVVESAISWMEQVANNNLHGYDQTNRWGPDFDCSSAVITAWEHAGVPVKTKGATYTGNMYNVFKRCGFIDVTSQIDLRTGAGLIRGDVLLNHTRHTAMYCGNGLEVEASINEKGRATGGMPGDQTGKEFFIRTYRNYPWNVVLRYQELTQSPSQPVTNTLTGNTGTVTASILNVRQYPHVSAKAIGWFKKGTQVSILENSHWYKIGTGRWICADYTKPVKDNDQVSIVKGIDVSAYQGVIDWKRVAADGVKFAILRGVVKDGSMDSRFEYNYQNAIANGIKIMGVYQYLYAVNENEARAAARNMIQKLNGKNVTIWLDLEWSTLRATNNVTNIANAYLTEVMTHGYDAGVYSNYDWYKNVYKPSQLKVQKFWIASHSYSGELKESLKPNVGELIWQWGKKGRVNGINGNVDMDFLYETIPSDRNVVQVTASSLNVRKYPSSVDPNATILSALPRGTVVAVLEDTLWYKVKTDNITGWCFAEYIKKN